MQHRLIVTENKVMNLYIYRINHLNQIMRKYNLEMKLQMFFDCFSLFEKDLYYLFADYYLKMGSKDAAANESSKK